jgi:hypothetical protein
MFSRKIYFSNKIFPLKEKMFPFGDFSPQKKRLVKGCYLSHIFHEHNWQVNI